MVVEEVLDGVVGAEDSRARKMVGGCGKGCCGCGRSGEGRAASV